LKAVLVLVGGLLPCTDIRREAFMKKGVGVFGLGLILSATIATAGENPILGTWKLKSFIERPGRTPE
jgi:hypothetical protein